ncbi:30S ribosomal protein S3 [Candidatus Bathyarchaeota archaeon]|nr:30S ribosomal protein S3 [Candidatus Bathyarchaeota archaeon]
MSAVRHFIDEATRREEIDAYLAKALEKAGYADAEIARTPIGTRVVIYAMKPGIVIGRRGENIRELTRVIEEKFKLSNPQIAVSEVEVPELNARIMGSRIVEALQRGTHFRRTGFWALTQIMKAGALGAEIVIRGKLTSQRHRYEKYKAGYMPRSGNPAIQNTRVAVTSVKLKQGMLGINIKIVPADAIFPDKIIFKSPAQKEAETAEPKIMPETQNTPTTDASEDENGETTDEEDK